ncbi:myomegalin-like [Neolamprologus brichardi]|uniref:myomegalin-like n=1 Tax=Neolamprologus brichardi TaxID=32507 RepID=UPI00164377B7|nr:myomegalin-like [Neolamprologus brichardi]
MSGFLYRGRHCGADKRARPKSMMDFSGDETDKGPPVQMHSLREFEQHLNDLKKENFSLKLRIYFLEEKIQQKFEESSDDVHKWNIELKVEVESLKKELEEKQELLDKAKSTAKSLSNQNEAELQRRLVVQQEEINHLQEIMATKVRLLQEEAELARVEAERMASLANTETQRYLTLEKQMLEKSQASGGTLNLQPLTDKDRMIEELTQDKHSLHLRVKELEVRLQNPSSSLHKDGGKNECQHECTVHAQMQVGQNFTCEIFELLPTAVYSAFIF